MIISRPPSVEPPIKCEVGELVRWELSADTSLLNDGTVHGSEEELLIGNSGWAGEARVLIDFDSSCKQSFSSQLLKLRY